MKINFEEQLAGLKLVGILSTEDGTFNFFEDRITGDYILGGCWFIICDDDDPPEASKPRLVYGRGKTIKKSAEMLFRIYHEEFFESARIRFLDHHSQFTQDLFLLWAKDGQDEQDIINKTHFYAEKERITESFTQFLQEWNLVG